MSPLSMVTAILTPSGRGAIATVAVRGPGAIAAADRNFQPASGTPLARSSANRVLYGRFRSTGGSEEEVIAVVTAADEVELHCHGGPAAAEAIVATLSAAGAERIPWQVFAKRGCGDEIRAEARCALAQAATPRTCAILLDQYRGALSRELDEIESLLAHASAENPGEAHRRLETLLDRWNRFGRHLTSPWRIVIAGPPNVGKSSLMNALLGYPRSITFDEPGTTRDVLCAPTAVDGWPIELVDTAGLRSGGDAVEAAGVERAERELAAADAVLAIADMTSPDRSLSWWRTLLPPEHVPWIRVGNKADLLSVQQRQRWQASSPDAMVVSAQTGDGIDALQETIRQRLIGQPPPAGAAVPFLPRQAELIRQVLRRNSASIE